jgi:sugar phosphate isomerase/epimerase
MNYVSSSCFEWTRLSDLITFSRQHHFYNLELSGNLEFDPQTESILSQVKDFSFLIHNYFPAPKDSLVLNLASATDSVRQKSIDHCRRAIDLCRHLHLPFYSVHAGFLFEAKPQDLGQKQTDLPRIERTQGLKIFRDSINQLLALEFPLLIENNVNSQENLVDGQNQLYLLAEPEETLRFFKQLNHPRLGLLVDLGHLNVSAQQLRFDKYEYLEALTPWIRAFHLSANNGIKDQGLAFNKDEWFIDVLKKFKDVAKIIELDKNQPPADLSKCIKIINAL